MSSIKKINKQDFENILFILNEKDSKYLMNAFELDKKSINYEIKDEILQDKTSLDKVNSIISEKIKIINENIVKEYSSLKEEYQNLNKIVNDYKDTIQRQHAEFKNYKKRIEKEKEYIKSSANEKIIEDLLPIIDSFEKAIELSGKDSDILQFRDGILMIQKQINDTLIKYGLEIINCIGKEFDPSKHEALQIDKSNNNYKCSTVISEWQKGYLFNGKVIRHSKVVVANPSNEINNNNKKADGDDNIAISKKDFENKILSNLNSKDYQYIKDSYEKIGDCYRLKKNYSKDKNRIQNINNIIKNIDIIQNT